MIATSTISSEGLSLREVTDRFEARLGEGRSEVDIFVELGTGFTVREAVAVLTGAVMRPVGSLDPDARADVAALRAAIQSVPGLTDFDGRSYASYLEA